MEAGWKSLTTDPNRKKQEANLRAKVNYDCTYMHL
jgi:hypothetical protein